MFVAVHQLRCIAARRWFLLILREYRPRGPEMERSLSPVLVPTTILLGLAIAGVLQIRPVLAGEAMVAIGLVIMAIGGYAKRVAP